MRWSPQPVHATLDALAAASRVWDVVIVGAGPAGAAAAWSLAGRSVSTLLVDKEAFPRAKVCGCCVNAAALAALGGIGLRDLVGEQGAVPLRELRLAAGGRAAGLPLRGGVSLSRRSLDASLLRRAIAAGAAFLPRTRAKLGEAAAGARSVRLRTPEGETTVTARLVLAADGLGGGLLDDEPGCANDTAAGSRIGVGASMAEAPRDYRPGVVYMACHRAGYVGLVRLEDGTLDLAAALDPAFTRGRGGVAATLAAVLGDAGFPAIPALAAAELRGTPRLTRRRRRLFADRVLVLGDAAGYVEPFTGEGIAWALRSGLAVSPIAAAATRHWSDGIGQEWARTHRVLLSRRQRACRTITRLLRHPTLTRAAIRALALAPWLAAPLVRSASAAEAPAPAGLQSTV